jgi:hypothetical protein
MSFMLNVTFFNSILIVVLLNAAMLGVLMLDDVVPSVLNEVMLRVVYSVLFEGRYAEHRYAE